MVSKLALLIQGLLVMVVLIASIGEARKLVEVAAKKNNIDGESSECLIPGILCKPKIPFPDIPPISCIPIFPDIPWPCVPLLLPPSESPSSPPESPSSPSESPNSPTESPNSPPESPSSPSDSPNSPPESPNSPSNSPSSPPKSSSSPFESSNSPSESPISSTETPSSSLLSQPTNS
ncbi:unnamed protein product [Trifolium pratense]|uniref:Uncharacterized protein n=1 Tax=Trifolium pratense TaxID=57577 RepID=A0ACB0K6D6_TRIPR|nr:unnamed protein product [Trifolium pratense]